MHRCSEVKLNIPVACDQPSTNTPQVGKAIVPATVNGYRCCVYICDHLCVSCCTAHIMYTRTLQGVSNELPHTTPPRLPDRAPLGGSWYIYIYSNLIYPKNPWAVHGRGRTLHGRGPGPQNPIYLRARILRVIYIQQLYQCMHLHRCCTAHSLKLPKLIMEVDHPLLWSFQGLCHPLPMIISGKVCTS